MSFILERAGRQKSLLRSSLWPFVGGAVDNSQWTREVSEEQSLDRVTLMNQRAGLFNRGDFLSAASNFFDGELYELCV